MADANTSAKEIDLSKINPLIGTNGDTSQVQFVLGFLSFTMQEATGGQLNLSPDDSLGLAFILDTCRAALAHTNTVAVTPGRD